MSDFVHGDQADLRQSYEKQHTGLDEKSQHVSEKQDLEAGTPTPATDVADNSDSEEVIRARELQQRMGFLRKMRQGEEWLDAKMGIETQGIDRIHEEDKKPPSILNVFFLWWSLTCHVGTIPIGILGTDDNVFGLTLGQATAMIVVGTILGAACTGYTGTLGPKVCFFSTFFYNYLLFNSTSSAASSGVWGLAPIKNEEWRN
jgi:hypothetical protein